MSMELMEEFLISTGKKSAIKYELKKERQEFSQIASVIQEQIEIVKNGWGYSQIEVFSDAAFLQPEQSLIRPDDFLGSSFTLDYLIDPARMHAGHNFGRIILKSGNWKKTFEVTARKFTAKEIDHRAHIQKKEIERLYRDYLDFRLKKISLNTWIARAEDSFARYEQGRRRGYHDEAVSGTDLFCGRSAGDRLYFA